MPDNTRMLRELLPTRQVAGEPRRRWFTSPRSDLIVWLRDDESVVGFQFCYDKDDREHALTWIQDRGFCHMRVDSGQSPFSRDTETPLLVMNGIFDANRILELFRAESGEVPSDFVHVVSAKLIELAEESREV